jgi:hypothetical protein
MPKDVSQKIRIMRVCPAPGYVPKIREKLELNGKPYAEQVKALQAEGVYLPGGWQACMEKLGFEVFDCLYDDYQLAAQWAEENNVLEVFRNTNPLLEIFTHQVQQFKPDIILFWTGAFFRVDRAHRMELRQKIKRPFLIAGVWGDEIPHGETYGGYFGDVNFMFTTNSGYQAKFEEAGIPAYTMGSGFDEAVKYNPDISTKSIEVLICGDTGYNKLDHIHRYEMFAKLAALPSVHIFASEPKSRRFYQRIAIFGLNTLALLPHFILRGFDQLLSRSRYTRWLPITKAVKYAALVRRTGVNAAGFFPQSKHPRQNYFNRKKPLRKLYPSKVSKGPLESSKYYELIAKSRIVLNVHRDEEEDYGNLRVYEATGIGSLLLTDRGESLKEFFKVDYGSDNAMETAEIATFTDAEDCRQKIDFLLKNPAVANRIAANGRIRTLTDHTVMKRCELIAPILIDKCEGLKKKSEIASTFVSATYDTNQYPISWDMAFFVEAAEITRRRIGADATIINILYPVDIAHLPGVGADSDRAVDLHGREFRIKHICGQIAEMFPDVTVNLIKDRSALEPLTRSRSMFRFPTEGLPHHTEYYRIVNANPHDVRGFSASHQALRYIENWKGTFTNKRIVCISIREYSFDVQRNSKMAEWVKFIESLDRNIYEVVIVPDTDQIATYDSSPLAKYRAFWPACFDVDLRFALYEKAFLNLGVNNGPMTASSLNKKVRFLMFKLLVAGVPHCTEEFISWSGFAVKGSPVYGTGFQKWVWEDDDFPVIQREFNDMVKKIEYGG